MAGTKLLENRVQQPIHLGIAQVADALDDAADPRFAAGIEESGNDSANIAGEGDRQSPDPQRAAAAFAVYWFHHNSLAHRSLSIIRKEATPVVGN